jgi:hypothetical protein
MVSSEETKQNEYFEDKLSRLMYVVTRKHRTPVGGIGILMNESERSIGPYRISSHATQSATLQCRTAF